MGNGVSIHQLAMVMLRLAVQNPRRTLLPTVGCLADSSTSGCSSDSASVKGVSSMLKDEAPGGPCPLRLDGVVVGAVMTHMSLFATAEAPPSCPIFSLFLAGQLRGLTRWVFIMVIVFWWCWTTTWFPFTKSMIGRVPSWEWGVVPLDCPSWVLLLGRGPSLWPFPWHLLESELNVTVWTDPSDGGFLLFFEWPPDPEAWGA